MWGFAAALRMGYTERQAWRMTPRKIDALFSAHLDLVAQEVGHIAALVLPQKQDAGIDDVIPL